jgi:putative chitinase
MNREAFFREVRLSFGKLTASQVDGFNHILDEWERRKLVDPRWLANMLAQTWHETATKMQPIREMGGEAYLKSKPYYPFVGEGLVQVTWAANYKKFGATKPGELLTWPIALRALFDGMIKGMFTGRKLADYFDHNTNDPLHARRIINGMDKAELIRRHHVHFLHAIELASKPAAKAA